MTVTLWIAWSIIYSFLKEMVLLGISRETILSTGRRWTTDDRPPRLKGKRTLQAIMLLVSSVVHRLWSVNANSPTKKNANSKPWRKRSPDWRRKRKPLPGD